MSETKKLEELDLFVWSDEDLAKPLKQSPKFGYLKSIGDNFRKIKEKDNKNTEAIEKIKTLLQSMQVTTYRIDITADIKENEEYTLPCSYIVRFWRYRDILQ